MGCGFVMRVLRLVRNRRRGRECRHEQQAEDQRQRNNL